MSRSLDVYAPYDNQFIETIPMQDVAAVKSALNTASDLHAEKSPLPLVERIAILNRTIEILENKKHDFAKQAAREGGKPLMDSIVELDRAIQGIRVAIESVNLLHGEEIPMGSTISSQNRLALTLREPIGPVVAISAFNHPFNLIVHQVIPAVITGCPVIVKPALTTPLSCLNLLTSLYEAGLPKEWAQVMVCENEAAELLVTDPRVRFFSFIGSAKVGWYLRSKLAPGVRCAMEHGGAAPVIVDEDADVEDMLPLLTKGGFYHAGQVCVSVQRVFVHESMVDQVSSGLAELAKTLKIGDPTFEDTEVGPLILPRENDRVANWVQEAIDEGAQLVCGGKKISESCYEPTVLLNPSSNTKVSSEEIFGPVVCVYSYRDRNEAIARANALPFSFQAAVFGKNIDRLLAAAKKLEAAAVMINDHTAFRVDWMPFGGRKTSGLGWGGIPYTMKDMAEEKLVVFHSSSL